MESGGINNVYFGHFSRGRPRVTTNSFNINYYYNL